MRYILLLAVLLMATVLHGQPTGRVLIPGTKCSLIPPKGFV